MMRMGRNAGSLHRIHTGLLILAAAVCALAPTVASAGVLSLLPERGVYTVGSTFNVRVSLTAAQDIYAAEAHLLFDPRTLAVERISTDGSILVSWPTPPAYNNVEGTIVFSGWTDVRFSGTGHLVTITFRVLQQGTSPVTMTTGTIIASDSRGSNIVERLESGVYTFEPARIMPAPAPADTPDEGALESEEESAAEAVEPVPTPSLAALALTFTVPGSILLEGSAFPRTRVIVRIESEGGVSQHEARADEAGVFSLSVRKEEPGQYRAWAVAAVPDGRESAPSETVSVTGEAPPLQMAALAALAADLPPILGIVAILALFATGAVIGYAAHRARRRRRAAVHTGLVQDA